MSQSIQLGPFELTSFLDHGAMGEVWRGRHRGDDTPVAVKVVTGRHARDPEYIASFRNEVRAVAGLDHPGIILLFDYGELPPQAEADSQGRLKAGSPYLVMELASQGALDSSMEGSPLSWREIRRTLRHLLDALAHAHARGVIHRDIKPANVLMGSDLPSRPGLKLTDFGLAHALQQEREGSTENAMGTPFYMAPEQFEGRWRDFGPWTDLYALGCMAWEMVTGAVPFEGQHFWQTAMLHLRQEPGELKPRGPVPEELEGWLRRLLAKEPQARFQLAADAAWALDQLEDPYEIEVDLSSSGGRTGGWATLGRRPEQSSTLLLEDQRDTQVDATPAHLGLAQTLDAAPAVVPDQSDATGHSSPEEYIRAPIPESWRPKRRRGPSLQLLGAGQGLYGLRALPMVGREQERDQLWESLRGVHREGLAHVALIHGPEGCGKSHLAHWISQRAAELGSATVLRAWHSQEEDSTASLGRALSAHLGCLGLDHQETLARLERLLRAQGIEDDYEWRALAALLDQGRSGQAQVRFARPGERYVLLSRFLHRLGRSRPVILWLEDVHHGSDALDFVDALCQRQASQPSPVLVMMTARDETLAQRPREAQSLEALMALPRARRVTLGPLPERQHAELVEQLLGLEGQLAQQLAARTAGNPLFAVHLVGDWVHRGLLVPGAHGFSLRSGVRLELPDSLHQVWVERLQDLLGKLPPGSQEALELAAALGGVFSEEDWAQLCQQSQIPRPLELRRALLAQGLLHHDKGQWSFAQSILRRSLERRARESDQWSTRHEACANLLLARDPTPRAGQALRLGRHLLEARRPTQALAHLERAIEDWIQTGDHHSAASALLLYERALHEAGAHQGDPRLGKLWIQRANLSIHLGQLQEALTWAEKARDASHTHGWVELLPDALLRLAHAHRVQGDVQQATLLYKKAFGLYHQQGRLPGQANCLRALAQLRGVDGPTRQRRLTRAQELFGELGDELAQGDCLRVLGRLLIPEGKLEQAQEVTLRAQEIFLRLGNHLGQGLCLNALAEISRKQGDLNGAEAGYRQALARYEAVGAANALFPRLNLALVLLERRRFDEARALLEQALVTVTRSGRKALQGCVHANLLPCAASEADWSAWDHHLEQARQLLQETGLLEEDIAWPACLAGDLAWEQHQPTRARDAWLLAQQQWTGLHNQERLQQVNALLQRHPAQAP